MPFELPVEGRPAHAEITCRLGDVAAVSVQGLLDERPLRFGERQRVECPRSRSGRAQTQIVAGDSRPVGYQHGPLDGVLEFADVSGPGVSEQRVQGGVAEPLECLVVACRLLRQESRRENGDVRLSVPQRRKVISTVFSR